MKKALFIFLLIFSAAKAATLYGVVTDKQTGESVPGAAVKIHSSETRTNENGEFAVRNLRTGTSIVEVKQDGYIPYFSTVNVKNNDILKIQLLPSRSEQKKNADSTDFDSGSRDISDYLNSVDVQDEEKPASDIQMSDDIQQPKEEGRKKGFFSFLNVFNKDKKESEPEARPVPRVEKRAEEPRRQRTAKSGKDVEYLYSQAIELFSKEEYEDAIGMFMLVENEDFDDAYRVSYYIGAAYKQLGFYDTAHTYFMKALGILSTMPAGESTINDRSLCCLEVGEIYIKRDLLGRAKKMFSDAAVGKDVNHPDLNAKAFQGLGFINRKLENYSAALKQYDQAIDTAKSTPLKAKLYLEKGDVYYEMKKIPDAEKAYRTSNTLAESDEAKKKLIFMDGLSKYEKYASEQKPDLILNTVIPRLKDALVIDENYTDVMYSIGYIEFLIGRGENKPDVVMDGRKYIEAVLKNDYTYRPVGGIGANDLLMKINNYLKDF